MVSPIPWPFSFVLKKGEKSLDRASGLIPDPVSSITTNLRPPFTPERMVIVPRLPIASTAFF